MLGFYRYMYPDAFSNRKARPEMFRHLADWSFGILSRVFLYAAVSCKPKWRVRNKEHGTPFPP